ncbi:MAG: hypothetical protein LBH19_09550, partial [Dysgonamonadaceae bacterium]|nr:hypothetical protein [Dysgonamonadaceae bacterium]
MQSQILQYPVQVTTQVTQHTPYAPQYYSGTMPRLRVSINNLDFQSPPLQVVVRMKITSSTFSLYTPDYLRVFFTTLDAGTLLQLQG